MLSVSIIIVNWNTREFLKECLPSIMEGTGGIFYEVIVVDNASKDNSAHYIEKNFPDICLIKNPVNAGFANACNQGVSVASGKYLLLLNPDTILEKDCIKRLVDFADQKPWFGAAGPRLLGRDGKVQNSVRKLPNFRNILIQNTIIRKILPLGGKGKLVNKLPSDTPSAVEQVSGAAFLIKKDIWDKIGGMDQRFFMFYEEVDLCRRLKELGYKVYYLPSAKIIHLGGGGRHKDRSAVFYNSVKSMFLYLRKYEDPAKVFWFNIIYKPLFALTLLLNVRNKEKRYFLRRWIIDFIKF